MEATAPLLPSWRNRQVIIASSVILALLAVPRFAAAVRALVVGPAFLALGVCVAVYLGVIILVRKDASRMPRTAYPALRPLVFTTPSAWSALLVKQSWEEDAGASRGPALLSSGTGAVRIALDRLLELIQRHFILPWYMRISPSRAFPHSTDTLIRHVLVNCIKQGETVDWSSLLVSRIVPIVKDHLQHYRTVEHLAPSSSSDQRSSLALPLPRNSHSTLSPQDHTGPSASGSIALIEVHLRKHLETIVEHLLPDADRSEVIKVLVREIVLGAVLMPVFDMLCDSDLWNRQIDDRGGRYLHEQRQVTRFLSALSTIPDTPSATVTPVKSKVAYPPQAVFISANSSTQQFDAFIRSIVRLKTLGEARRFRADIERELRLARGVLTQDEEPDQAGKDGDRAAKNARRYVQRLERAATQVEARITALSGRSSKPELFRSPQSVDNMPSSQYNISLHSVLSDPSSLAYWLEFMDRRGRSKLVQFWLTVEGFKDPLASTDPIMSSFAQAGQADDISKGSSTMPDDVAFLYEMYFASEDMGVSKADIEVMHTFTVAPTAPPSAWSSQAVGRAVYSAQRAVYEQMEEADWTEFKRSELYRKALQDLARHGSIIPRDATFFSPRSVTSPIAVPPSMPTKPVRHVSSPILENRLKRLSVRPGPALVNGNFTPATTVTPSASVSTTPPTFSRGVSQLRSPIPAGYLPPLSMSAQSTRPSTPPRRHKHLEALMTGQDMSAEASSERRIFADDSAEGREEGDDDFVQIERMEAIQAALSEIIASDDVSASHITSQTSPTSETPLPSMTTSLVLPPNTDKEEATMAPQASRSVDDLRTLPSPRANLVAMDRSRLFDDFAEVPGSGEGDGEAGGPEFIRLAAPGNLHLGPEIARLQAKVQDLVKQENLLEGLIRRADLTGNEAELKLLQKSIATVRRDLRGSVFQKAQYEQQEEEHRLVPGRTVVSIPSAHVILDEAEGKQVARYVVRVSQGAAEAQGGSWMVYRRYNQFFELDRAIREWAEKSSDREIVRDVRSLVELPGKKLGPSTSAGLMESRRLGLERYLRSLISSSRFCESDILRNFLSRSPSLAPGQGLTASIASLAPHNIVKSLYKTVATTLDDTPLGPSMFDMIQSTLNRQFNDVAGGLGEVVELGGELFGFGSSIAPPVLRGTNGTGLAASPIVQDAVNKGQTPISVAGESGSTVFTAPICDLFIELFDLDESNWLRRQAIVVILQQFLGSTIERKVRDTLRNVSTPSTVEKLLCTFTDTLFPNGERRPPSEERSEQEKHATRYRASRKLALLIPDIAANMIGRSNARRAARRVFGVLQDRRLNQHLILKIIDEVIGAMFPPSPLRAAVKVK